IGKRVKDSECRRSEPNGEPHWRCRFCLSERCGTAKKRIQIGRASGLGFQADPQSHGHGLGVHEHDFPITFRVLIVSVDTSWRVVPVQPSANDPVTATFCPTCLLRSAEPARASDVDGIMSILILSLSSFGQLHALLDDLMSRRCRNIPRNILPAIDIERWRHLVRTRFDISELQRWSTVPLRLIVGYGFIAHGYAKIMNGPDHFADSIQALGVPAPHLMAWATIGFELLGGLAVLVGAYIPAMSVPLAV